MSKENVEIVRDAYARYNAGEKTAELWFWHRDAEYHAAREDPDSAVHRGIDAIRKHQVFLWVRFIGHGATSGIPIDMELAHLYTLRDGKAARVVEYMDRNEALEAAGLRE
jgi:ketosteroid isomerase-like protein